MKFDINLGTAWRAESGDSYDCVEFDELYKKRFFVIDCLDYGLDIDDCRYNSGNYFRPNTGEAQAYADRLNAVPKRMEQTDE